MSIKLACHVHSDWSYDGRYSLQALATIFARHGYDAVLTTEHDRGFDEERRQRHREACQAASTERILVIPGIEYSDPANRIHILVWGDVPFIGCSIETGSTLTAAAEGRGVAVMAHPARRQAWRAFQPEWLRHLAGIEVWNRKTDGWCPGKQAAALIQQTGLPAFVGMDFHDRRQLFPLATILDGETVSESAILAALAGGAFESRALGLPVTKFRGRLLGSLLRSAEFGRRRAAAIYRMLSVTKRASRPPSTHAQ